MLSKTQKILYKNLFNYTLKIYKLQFESYYKTKEQLKQIKEKLLRDIKAIDEVANKQWLIDQLNK